MAKQVKTERQGTYTKATPEASARAQDDAAIAQAIMILDKRLRVAGSVMDSPQAVAAYLRLKMAEHKDEHFGMMLLASDNSLIGYHEVFSGTVDSCAVYRRPVARLWLEHNAAACILVHNHPSGDTYPSTADFSLTTSMVALGSALDVRVIDHFIIGGAWNDRSAPYHSFSEHGQL